MLAYMHICVFVISAIPLLNGGLSAPRSGTGGERCSAPMVGFLFCFLQITYSFTEGTCRNYGGYFIAGFVSSSSSSSSSTPTSTTSPPIWHTNIPTTTGPPNDGICYYSESRCPTGWAQNGQCYTGYEYMSCSSCKNIGGYRPSPSSNLCYYYTKTCDHIRLDANECHTNTSVYRCRNFRPPML